MVCGRETPCRCGDGCGAGRQTRILPVNREADFFRWLENIQPWCISRQLWWGHQVPVWTTPAGETIIARSEAEAQAKAGAGVPLTRDPDVLDTWFSSALWPFSTLGWPDETAELAKYYPNSVLITGFDILFFWVARMMMSGLFLKDKVPFHTVYLHGLVRDEKGRKMSKTIGNVIDPLVVIDELGADALRFTLASLAAQGRDPKLGPKTAESYRSFCTKLWNATRFAEMNGCRLNPAFDPKTAKMPLNRWILDAADGALSEIEAGLATFRFNDAANAAYRFTWNTFCDWYVELAKPTLQFEPTFVEGHEERKTETQAVAAFILTRIVKMLHPFMPFITEVGLKDTAAEAEIGFLVDLIAEVRSVRAEMNVPPSSIVELIPVEPQEFQQSKKWDLLNKFASELKRLARIDFKVPEKSPRQQSVQIVVRGALAALPLVGIIDIAAEKKRLAGEMDKLTKDIEATIRKLENPDFVFRAPAEIIDENRERVSDWSTRRTRVAEALARLG
jgi:valyl-tRNA synthetase